MESKIFCFTLLMASSKAVLPDSGDICYNVFSASLNFCISAPTV